jgi:hypothetical protein
VKLRDTPNPPGKPSLNLFDLKGKRRAGGSESPTAATAATALFLMVILYLPVDLLQNSSTSFNSTKRTPQSNPSKGDCPPISSSSSYSAAVVDYIMKDIAVYKSWKSTQHLQYEHEVSLGFR